MVSTNKQRRAQGKKALARAVEQAQHMEQKYHKRRRTIIIVFSTLLAILIGSGSTYLWYKHDKYQKKIAVSTLCHYSQLQEDVPLLPNIGMPNSEWVNKHGDVHVTFHTSQGDIPVTLDRNLAPCGVHSIEYLIGKKYFDHTQCHREVNSTMMSILQCGASTPEGANDAGYTSTSEPVQGLSDLSDPAVVKQFSSVLKNQQTLNILQYQQHAVLYPEGAIALAGGNGLDGQTFVSGAQFFFVTHPTLLAPSYPVIGHVDAPGMQILTKIRHHGIMATPSGSKEEGKPKIPVVFNSVTIP